MIIMPQASVPAGVVIERAPGYSVHASDGVITTAIARGAAVVFQFTFWADEPPDSTAAREMAPNSVAPLDNVKRMLKTGVRLTPDVAFQFALSIMTTLTTLPEDRKVAYGIPKDLQVKQQPAAPAP